MGGMIQPYPSVYGPYDKILPRHGIGIELPLNFVVEDKIVSFTVDYAHIPLEASLYPNISKNDFSVININMRIRSRLLDAQS